MKSVVFLTLLTLGIAAGKGKVSVPGPHQPHILEHNVFVTVYFQFTQVLNVGVRRCSTTKSSFLAPVPGTITMRSTAVGMALSGQDVVMDSRTTWTLSGKGKTHVALCSMSDTCPH